MLDELICRLPEYKTDNKNNYYYLQMYRTPKGNWTVQYWSYKLRKQLGMGAMGETLEDCLKCFLNTK